MVTYAEKIEALKTSERILKAVLEFRKDHPPRSSPCPMNPLGAMTQPTT